MLLNKREKQNTQVDTDVMCKTTNKICTKKENESGKAEEIMMKTAFPLFLS